MIRFGSADCHYLACAGGSITGATKLAVQNLAKEAELRMHEHHSLAPG
jgi:hypothetical protein